MRKKFNNICTNPLSETMDSLADSLFNNPLPYTNDVLPTAKNRQPNRVLIFSHKQGFRHNATSYHERFVLVLMLRGSGT
ncbi:MAG TPA: hypothetical protein PLK08_08440, partial [Phycisphaerae bacterium]|nr:hypothetical protein [Phycisphaerae bacterium]